MIEVIEPATEQVMAEVPRAGVEEVDAAVARAKARVPGLARASRPADRARAAAPPRRRARGRAPDELATLEARNAGKPIADARGEMGMVVETLPLLRRRAGAAARARRSRSPAAST